jgi:hypothetical protein
MNNISQDISDTIISNNYISYEKVLSTFTTLPPIPKKNKSFTKATSSSEALYEVTQLLPMISDKRSSDHKSWSMIGLVLFNIGNGSRNAIEEWIAFSKRTNTFNEEDCITTWINMKPSFHTIRIIFYYVKMDNIEAYTIYKNTITKNKCSELLRINDFELIEMDCAELLYILYKDIFFYDDTWYEYLENNWNSTKNCMQLEKYIPNLRDAIDIELKKLKDKLDENDNEKRDAEDEGRNWNDIAKTEQEIKNKLNTLKHTRKQICRTGFKNNIIKECKLLFYDKSAVQCLKIIDNIENETNEYIIDKTISNNTILNINNSTYTTHTSNTITDIDKNKDLELIKFNEFILGYQSNEKFIRQNIVKKTFDEKYGKITKISKHRFTQLLIDAGIKIEFDKVNSNKIYIKQK